MKSCLNYQNSQTSENLETWNLCFKDIRLLKKPKRSKLNCLKSQILFVCLRIHESRSCSSAQSWGAIIWWGEVTAAFCDSRVCACVRACMCVGFSLRGAHFAGVLTGWTQSVCWYAWCGGRSPISDWTPPGRDATTNIYVDPPSLTWVLLAAHLMQIIYHNVGTKTHLKYSDLWERGGIK